MKIHQWIFAQFEDLPPDELAEIVVYLKACEITALWLCGSTLCNYKLTTAGTVRKFELELFCRQKITISPLFRLFSKLDSLSLKIASPWIIYRVVNFNWTSLPHSLTSLEVNFTNGFFALNNALLQRKIVFRGLIHLVLGCNTRCKTLKELPNWSNHFPRLETLKLLWNQSFMVTRGYGLLLDLRLCQLPRTLTVFQSSHSTLILDYESPTHGWPEGLTDLSLFIDPHFQNTIRYQVFNLRLPPHLTRLQFSAPYSNASQAFDWNNFPATVEHLSLSLPGFNAELIEKLPKSITHLETLPFSFGDSQQAIKALPPNLTFFSWPIIPEDAIIEAVSALPQSLREFYFNDTNPRRGRFYDLAIIPLLPRNLKSVHLACTSSSRHPICRLNSNIISLRLSELNKQILENVLHDSLETLIVDNPSNLDPYTAASLIPRSLTHLQGPLASFLKDGDNIQHLPKGLKTLILGSDMEYFNIKGSSYHLPRTLQTLSLGKIMIKNSEWFQDLPPLLTNLDLEFGSNQIPQAAFKLPCPQLQRLTLTTYELLSYDVGALFCHLPQSLQSLSIIARSDINVKSEDFKHLPRKLNRLILPHTRFLDAKCMLDAPPRLIELSLNRRRPDWFC